MFTTLGTRLVAHEDAALCVSWRGNSIITGGSDERVRVWDPKDLVLPRQSMQPPCLGVVSVDSTGDGAIVVASSMDGRIRAYEVATGTCMSDVFTGTQESWTAAVAPMRAAKGSLLVATGTGKGDVNVFTLPLPEAPAAAAAATGEAAADVKDESADPEAKRADGADVTPTAALPSQVLAGGARSFAQCVAYSRDGAQLAAGHASGELCLFDAARGERVLTVSASSAPLRAAAFAPSGDLLVCGGDDALLRVLDARVGAQVHQFAGHGDWVMGLDWAPSGTQLCSAGEALKVWDWRTQLPLHTFDLAARGRGHHVFGARYSDDGARIAAVTEGGSLVVLATGDK